jgi:Bacterial Ig domain
MSERLRRLLPEILVCLAFLGLTAVMTWPWVLHLRDHCSDNGDPYLVSWTLWWDFHQTFHDPLHLFDGNVFFPMKYSLAFSEHNYGIALPFFPLFWLGVRPLTVHGLAMLLGFAFSGYGAFRLSRTLTGSTGAAWVTGIAFAFVPYRFGQMPHLPYMFSGWIPILLEALVLFVRERTPRRAAWLGTAFFLNGLSVIHWLVLTLVPLAATGLALGFRNDAVRDRAGLKRGALALGIAGFALLPFLIPYQQAAKLYGFTRHAGDAMHYSAVPRDWLSMDYWNRTWRGFAEWPAPSERLLFPGLLLLLLPLAAVLLSRAATAGPAPGSPTPPFDPRGRNLLRWLDGISVVAGTFAFFAASPAGIHIRLGGKEVFRATESPRALAVFSLALLVRWWIAYPKALPFVRGRNLPESLSLLRRPDAILVGGIWAVLGFLGSLGMNFPFHRVLFEAVFLFRSVRVPARWAMVAYLGLAVLAGAGAQELADAWRRHGSRARAAALVFVLAGLGLLFEDRAAPLELVRGEADPDEVTLFLAKTPMKGGLVELPAGTEDHGNYRAMLRAADHGKPLVTAVSGFGSPFVSRIEEDERKAPIPDELFDFLERIPTSYLLVHDSWLSPELRGPHREWLARGMASGRLLFVKRFDGRARNELYAVVKNEPQAKALDPLPWTPAGGPLPPPALYREDPTLIGSIDGPAEGAVVNGPLTVRGWARVSGEDLQVTVTIDGEERRFLKGARVPRLDVQAAVPSLGDCRNAGFEGTYAFEAGDEGPHEIQVLFRASDGRQRHYPPRSFTWKR